MLCGDFEILMLVGLVLLDGVYLYMLVLDVDGCVIGGYVVSGCVVCMMVEILFVLLFVYCFLCEFDVGIGFNELVICCELGGDVV